MGNNPTMCYGAHRGMPISSSGLRWTDDNDDDHTITRTAEIQHKHKILYLFFSNNFRIIFISLTDK